MAQLNNPAGRLLALLRAYQESASEDESILVTWAGVLGVEDHPTALAQLPYVAALLPAIDQAVGLSGQGELQQLVATFRPFWLRAVFFPEWHGVQTPSPGAQLIDEGSLAALGGLSVHLSATASEGLIPPEASVRDLRGTVLEAIDHLKGADELAAAVRELLLARLHEVLWALDHLSMGGPGAVTAATERLAGAVAVQVPQSERVKSPVARLLAVVGAVWVVFKHGPEAKDALVAWTEVARSIANRG